MRGEHFVSVDYGIVHPGSSPHARGARAKLIRVLVGRRIIPACAGSTASPVESTGRRWDHPRMRGEHSETSLPRSMAMGSSPHARGARVPRRRGIRARGIIPACAGSTAHAPARRTSGEDHPRMRGEHCRELVSYTMWQGSSPHARGARPARHGDRDWPGIIPACAGSTRLRVLQQGDHPRMRGEHRIAADTPQLFVGSSPHARGAPVALHAALRHAGIIPACAGSTGSPGSSDDMSPGSSPHARGAPVGMLDADRAAGIIPACAGSTGSRPAR